MKRLLYALLMAFLAAALLSGCKKKPEAEPEPILPASVQVTPAAVALTEGETTTLSAKVLPEKAEYSGIVWSSSDASVATVTNSGLVTAIKAGTATITAKAGNTASGEAVVTVAAKIVRVTGVEVDKRSVVLEEGESEVITATVLPEDATNKTFTWESSDPSIATVDNSGKVTGVKAGETTVIVTTADGPCRVVCEVLVKPKTIAVTGVELDKASQDLYIGDTFTLTATVSPENATDKRVYWDTSDETVATVSSSGIVTAHAEGVAFIVVTTYDGDFSASCEVTVSQKKNPVTGVSIENWAMTLLPGQAGQIKYAVTPEDATNKEVTFESSDSAVAKVDNQGKVTAVAPGSAKVTITTVDGGFTAGCTVTVKEPPASIVVDGVYYSVSATDLAVIAPPDEVKYSGHITVPGTIIYEDIEYKVTAIEHRAFRDSPDLLSVTLAEGIQKIESRAFYHCVNLEAVSLPSTVYWINEINPVFTLCPKLEISVNKTGGKVYFFMQDHALYQPSQNDILLRWVPEKLTGTFEVLDGTTVIKEFSLAHTSIDKLVIPRSVESIETNFFMGTYDDGEWLCKTPLEIELNWITAEEVNAITTNESDPSFFFFRYMDRSQITVTVPKGTKALYEAHWLWSACGSIVEREE